MNILEVSNENPVVLNGYIDAAGQLQFQHSSGSLADHSQTLHAVHETADSITIELRDFGGWLISAEDEEQRWERGEGCAKRTFTGEMTDPLEVKVTGTGTGTATQPTKRKIYLKVQPKGSLPI